MIENYVAFDFETASGKNPCSIGIVEFNRGKVVDEYYSFIEEFPGSNYQKEIEVNQKIRCL